MAFEVERFEWVDSGRLEVAGRWHGVRGRRFVRPELVVQAGDAQRRMLAVLDHKPWAADDGEQWIAAFPWEGERLELTAAELAVAPSLTVALPVPRTAAPRHTKPVASADPREPPRGGDDDVAALRAQLMTEQATVRRLAAELDDAHQGLAAAAGAADDHDALERERDAALAARDDAVARAKLDPDGVVEERDLAVFERSAALHERDEALDERAASNFERKGAIAERDAALAERDRAVKAHRAAVRDLEALERHVAAAGQAPAPAEWISASEPVAAPDPATTPDPGEPDGEHAAGETPSSARVKRVAALIVLIVWTILVYKILHGLV